MRRDFMFGAVFSAALAVAVSAQSAGQTPTGEQDRNRSGRNDAAQSVTITGCLRSADSAASTAGEGAPTPSANAPASSARGGYILTDVTSGASTATATPATPTPDATANPTGTTGSATAKSYRLTGSASNFSSLVGKRVEVKGTVQERAGAAGAGASSTAGENPAGSTAPKSGMGSTNTMPQFRVSSVSEVPGTCSDSK